MLVAAQLLRLGFQGSLTIVEPRSGLGKGLAYSTRYDAHVLNVAAGKMSAFPDHASHFLEWLRARHDSGASAGAFATRKLYGEYLQGLFEEELNRTAGNLRFRHICAEAVSVRSAGPSARIALSNGESIEARAAVLALGNPASSRALGRLPAASDSCVQPSPWLDDALSLRRPSERVLLLGTGLTAIDAAVALLGAGEDSQVVMVSRRGLLPAVHSSCLPAPDLPRFPAHGSLASIVREILARVAWMKSNGYCWRLAVDSMRPVSNQLWTGLAPGEQRRFLRHLKPYWEPHRHRMAPDMARRIQSLRSQGRLSVLAGQIAGISQKSDCIEVLVALRDGMEERLIVDRVINCTGIVEHYNENPRPLIRSLIADGEATANDLGIGFRTDSRGALRNSAGSAAQVLFTLGPPRRGELFETTAVPEIRAQAAELARLLLAL